MRRREFITLLGGAAATWPMVAGAQQGERMRRVAVLTGGGDSDTETQARLTAFKEGLEKAGWSEGRNIQTEYRFAIADQERTRTLAEELLRLSPDVFVAHSTLVLSTVQKLTSAVPIVFVSVSDPVSAGFVPSLAKPGGNITGFTNFEYAMGGKWLTLLKEAAPGVNRVAAATFQDDPAWSRYFAAIEAMAPSLNIQLTKMFLGVPSEIVRAIDTFAQEPRGGILVLPNPKALLNREIIAAVATRHSLPMVAPARVYATSGALMSYGVDVADLFRRSAAYVDRILRGAKPGDLPVQQPTKYEFVINMRAARAMGFAMPPALPLRADEVIE